MSSTTTSTSRQRAAGMVVLLVVSMAFWGGTWPSGKIVGGVAPLDLTVFARFLVTALSLGAVCLARRERLALPRASALWTLVAALLMSGYNYLFLGGLHWGLSGKGGVIVTCLNPPLTFAIAAGVFRRRVGLRESIGLALGIAAMVLLLEIWRVGPEEVFRSGNLFFLSAALAWSLLTVVSQVAQRNVGYMAFSFWVYVFSTVMNFAVLGLRGMHVEALGSGVFWANVLYLGVGATAFATTVFFLASKRLGAHRAGSFILLVPGFALLLSWFLLGEVPTWPTLVGGAVAIAAVYLINTPRSRPKDAAQVLNEVLDRGPAGQLLSALGRRLHMPRGIVVQAAEAKRLARRYDATAGVARKGGEPIHLDSVQRHLGDLAPSEVYAYSPTQGNAELRVLWRERMLEKNPGLAGVTMTLPTVVPGLTFGVSAAADLFADPGDTLMVGIPCWDNYEHIFTLRHGCVIRPWNLVGADGLDLSALRGALVGAARARPKAMVLLNFPHNPTGYSPTPAEADALAMELVAAAEGGMRLVVILDDAYHGLVYEPGVLRESLFARLARAHDRILAVKVDGTTKEDLAWGFRVAFMTLAAKGLDEEQCRALEDKLAGEIRSLVSSSSTPAQSLLLRALRSPEYRKEKEQALEVLTARYRKVKEVLRKLHDPELASVLPFNSGYFLTFRLPAATAERTRQALLSQEGIGTVSLRGDLLRIAYAAVDLEGLEPMLEAVYRVLRSTRGNGT